MSFWQVFIAMALLCAGFVLWPLLKTYRFSKKALREDVRIDICEDINEQNLVDLEQTLAIGEISSTEFASLKRDLEKTLTHDNEHAKAQFHVPITSKKRSRALLLVVCVAVPLAALIMYFVLGAKPDWEIFQSLRTLQNSSSETYTANAFDLYRQITERVKKRPDDAELRFLQASAAMASGQHDSAIRHYRDLVEEHPEAPVVLYELTQALMQRSGGTITPEIRLHIQKLLSLAPNMPSALGLAGVDAFQQGSYQEAVDFWTTALKSAAPNSAEAAAFSEAIARAQIALSASGGSSPRDSEASSATESLQVQVSVEEGIELTGEETVYVYARAWQGSKMPLAIKQMKVNTLPVMVRLDKSAAMAPGMDLTSSPQLEIVARISMNGGAAARSGDWLASMGPIILSKLDTPIELHISEKIP